VNKLTTAEEAVKKVKDGDVLLVGGFLKGGSPETIIKALLETSSAKNLTVVSNDTGMADTNMIKVMKEGRVSKVLATYIGGNPMTGQMLIDDPTALNSILRHTGQKYLRRRGHRRLLYSRGRRTQP
jgi:acetate CoA/acetoacetate CoA-transferase alpha subunit